jgi:putative Mg2+ transporter-C (MgtC) family protein
MNKNARQWRIGVKVESRRRSLKLACRRTLALSLLDAHSYLDVPTCNAVDAFRAGVPFRVPSRLPMTAPDDVLSWTDVVIRLLAATGIGGAIGLNRELTRKPAGLRTHALVALGSALATVSALQLGPAETSHVDAAARVIQGIVAGIGFIGGGVILHTEGRNVVGLTTAATIWVAAALGVSCAVGQWRVAGSAVLIALVVLVVGRGIEGSLHRIKRDGDEKTGNRQPGPGNSASR